MQNQTTELESISLEQLETVTGGGEDGPGPGDDYEKGAETTGPDTSGFGSGSDDTSVSM